MCILLIYEYYHNARTLQTNNADWLKGVDITCNCNYNNPIGCQYYENICCLGKP